MEEYRSSPAKRQCSQNDKYNTRKNASGIRKIAVVVAETSPQKYGRRGEIRAREMEKCWFGSRHFLQVAYI